MNGKPASAGYYNSVAVEKAAQMEGIWARSINGDAFQDEVKDRAVRLIRENLGAVDLVVYSLAAPRRTDPDTGETYTSVLKPIGRAYTAKTVDTDKEIVQDVTIEPSDESEVASTVKVMGGEDWNRWIAALDAGGVLADGVTTVAYDYIGPEITWPIYRDGTIGQAKKHLLATAGELDARLGKRGGRALLSVNKAVVTQASSAIPVVPLYISILFKVMKEKKIHEGCIEQIQRLFQDRLFNDAPIELDECGRVRVDDWEMREDVQSEVRELWGHVTTENLNEISDFEGYRSDFLKLFGFGFPEIDYDRHTDPERFLAET